MSGVPFIHPAMLERLMEPKPCTLTSLRSSATAFEAMGQQFSADWCRDMASECAAFGAIGDAIYSDFARQMAERVEAKWAEYHQTGEVK